MKTIVFGGSGFVGSHVADTLSEAGHEVRIFDLKPSKYLKPGQEMIVGNILEPEAVRKAVESCDYIYNFAGIADLDDASTKPVDTVLLNIYANTIILDAAVDVKCKRFLYASTIYVYSGKGGFYKCSKQAAESYVEEYNRRYGLDYTLLRYGTLYGPRSDHRNSVYRYLYDALTKKRISVSASGQELREYIHVRDAAELSVRVLDSEYANTRVTITGHQTTRFRDFLELIKEMMNDEIDIEYKEVQENGVHYSLTPYSYVPKVGHKLTTNRYVDLGQGLLECLAEVDSNLGRET
ncbi:MAG: NAD-dependent epimerase/dehydratase family protein [Candidatus Thorarchaeota archaeon]